MSRKSYYRKKMKEYKKAKSELSKAEDEAINILDSIKDSFNGFDNVYAQTDVLYGEVIDNFNDKSEEVSERIKQLISGAEEKYYTILKNLKKSTHLYEHYKELYERACRDDD